MADELELELSYEGDGGEEGGYEEEVDYGESEGEEPARRGHDEDEEGAIPDAREQRSQPPVGIDKKVRMITEDALY